MEIRKLGPEDGAAYRDLRLQALKEAPEAFSSSYEEESHYDVDFFAQRFHSGAATTLGAFCDNMLAGVVTLLPGAKMKTRHKADLVGMYVAPEFRKVGLGKALIAEGLRLAKERGGISHVYLGVSSTNMPAKKLYESTGFTAYGTDPHSMKVDGRFVSEDLMVISVP